MRSLDTENTTAEGLKESGHAAESEQLQKSARQFIEIFSPIQSTQRDTEPKMWLKSYFWAFNYSVKCRGPIFFLKPKNSILSFSSEIRHYIANYVKNMKQKQQPQWVVPEQNKIFFLTTGPFLASLEKYLLVDSLRDFMTFSSLWKSKVSGRKTVPITGNSKWESEFYISGPPCDHMQVFRTIWPKLTSFI